MLDGVPREDEDDESVGDTIEPMKLTMAVLNPLLCANAGTGPAMRLRRRSEENPRLVNGSENFRPIPNQF